MEPNLCGQKTGDIINDTGQDIPALRVSARQGDLIDLNVLQETLACGEKLETLSLNSDDKALATSSDTHLDFNDSGGDTEEDRSSKSPVKIEASAMSVPSVVVNLDEEGRRGNVGDDDMDPLLTVDDTESQSSDLINFDTVSYDVINPQDNDEDDDERSLATMSSLSCDIKFDSPQKHSQASSLINLLDASLKDAVSLERSQSAQLFVGGTTSGTSSCPSSPSLRSSKNVSPAVDESGSDVLQLCEDSNDEDHQCLLKLEEKSELRNGSQTNLVPEDLGIVHHEGIIDHACVQEIPVRPTNSQHVQSSCGPESPKNSEIEVIRATNAVSFDLVLPSEMNVEDRSTVCNIDNTDVFGGVEAKNNITSESSCKFNDFQKEQDILVLCEDIDCNAVLNTLQEVQSCGKIPSLLTDIPPNSKSACETAYVQNEEQCPEINRSLPFNGPESSFIQSLQEVPVVSSKENEVLKCSVITNVVSESEAESVLTTSVPSLFDSTLPLTSSSKDSEGKACEDSVISAVVTADCWEETEKTSPKRKEYDCGDSISLTEIIPSNCADIVPTATSPSILEKDLVLAVSSPYPSQEESPPTSMKSQPDDGDSVVGVSLENIKQILEEDYQLLDSTQSVKTPSPVDSAVSVSDFVPSDESLQQKSYESPNETTELSSLEGTSIVSPSIEGEPSAQVLVDEIATIFSADQSTSKDYLLQQSSDQIHQPDVAVSHEENLPLSPDYVVDKTEPMSKEESKLELERRSTTLTVNATEAVDELQVEQESLEGISEQLQNILTLRENCGTCDKSCSCAVNPTSENSCSDNCKPCDVEQEKSSVQDDIFNNSSEIVLTQKKHPSPKIERPTSLDSVNLRGTRCQEPVGMTFSEFLGIGKMTSPNGSRPTNVTSDGMTLDAKKYNVAALDEAQQVASCLVDEILKIAIMRAEAKLNVDKSACDKVDDTVNVASVLVDQVLRTASARVLSIESQKAEIPACDGDNTEDKTSRNCIATEVSSKTPVDAFNPLSEVSKILDSCVEEASVLKSSESKETFSSLTEVKNKVVVEVAERPAEPLSDRNKDDSSNTSFDVDPNLTDDCASENFHISGENSFNDFIAEEDCKDHVSMSTSASSLDNTTTESARSSKSSLLSKSDVGLRSEASVFVDGVLELAVRKYEESSSSDSSPVKLKGLALDSDWQQEEEELATPCGEMLTEHFMDFESGRNVSVFCSIPERGEDHLLAYDRIVNTIGNREVDSDTGKSVSVFRSEEEVFYEIQRPSACTSVFESVEEEDEDMIDTTVPLEDRSDLVLHAPGTFKHPEVEHMDLSDVQYNKDCDAFEDAVDAFLTKERLAKDDVKNCLTPDTTTEDKSNISDHSPSQWSETNEYIEDITNSVVRRKHPEYDLSNQEEKRKMAEKWANGGEFEVPDTPEMREKQRAIREALDSTEDVPAKLCKLALTEGGLINDALRREAWPRMLGLDPNIEIDAPSLEDLKSHPEYGQVVLDVNRSLKRFPPDIPKDQRETLQDKLTRLIMYVISKHPHLRYYQGYHDVAVTFLLVVGESVAFQIMERLSTENLSDCMQPTMERTSYLLHFIYPLLHRLHPTLAEYLERSEVGTMFCLPWFLTWFGHSLDRYQDVVRLYDHFLASPPLAPLYVAAVLVAHRADEVLAVDCDMAAIHALLSHIPDSLPLEILLHDATDLYDRFPPESIEKEVEERFKNEQELRVHEMESRERMRRQRALMRRHGGGPGSGSWQVAEFQDRIGPAMMVFNRWIPPWVVQQQRLSMRLLFASATFFVGFYVYARGGDMLPYP